MICWKPSDKSVKLAPWPDVERETAGWSTVGACFTHVRAKNFQTRQALVFIHAMHMIVRDGLDPYDVHAALLGLEEYQDGLADDMPGVVR